MLVMDIVWERMLIQFAKMMSNRTIFVIDKGTHWAFYIDHSENIVLRSRHDKRGGEEDAIFWATIPKERMLVVTSITWGKHVGIMSVLAETREMSGTTHMDVMPDGPKAHEDDDEDKRHKKPKAHEHDDEEDEDKAAHRRKPKAHEDDDDDKAHRHDDDKAHEHDEDDDEKGAHPKKPKAHEHDDDDDDKAGHRKKPRKRKKPKAHEDDDGDEEDDEEE